MLKFSEEEKGRRIDPTMTTPNTQEHVEIVSADLKIVRHSCKKVWVKDDILHVWLNKEDYYMYPMKSILRVHVRTVPLTT